VKAWPGPALLGTVLTLMLLGPVSAGADAPPTGQADPFRFTLPEVILSGVPFTMTVEDTGRVGLLEVRLESRTSGPVSILASGTFQEGRAVLEEIRLTRGDARSLLLKGELAPNRSEPLVRDLTQQISVRVLPGWLSLLPPLLAIGLALLTRQVLVALFLGVWVGAWILYGWNPGLAFLHVGDRFLVAALADRSHASILIFTCLLGGMVGILSRAGATEGLVQWLTGKVRTRRGGQRSTAIMGTVIFFDDYANTLLVGNAMRPLTDRLRISREKLAYLVDSTAAPVTTVAVISTWIGFEVGLIQEAMVRLNGGGSAYTFFLRSIPYSFYPLLTIWFVYLVSCLGRDFGPMLAAETRAWVRGEVLRPGAQPASDTQAFESGVGDQEPAHPLLAVIPVLLVILLTGLGLWWDGFRKLQEAGAVDRSLRAVLNAADSFDVLMWASMGGAVSAFLLMTAARRLRLREAVEGWLAGARAMLIALVILLLAWSLSAVCTELQTAPFLVELCRGGLTARLLPAMSFILASGISFATGTSWGTMAILMPLVFPLGALLPGGEGLAPHVATGIHLATVSAVLAGAVFGDHCSPISDTTILSSLASGSDHVDHVRTQLPYALTVAATALLLGYLPTGYGLSPFFSLAGGALLLLGILLWRGRRAGVPS
jgi:Na+/H+ antiporter NhaC